MADIDDDFDGGFYDEDGYLYVEEACDAADDLAEQVVPSPPYYDYDEDHDYWDPYEYFADLEYNSEGYDDCKVPVFNGLSQKRKAQSVDARQVKRKKAEDADQTNNQKGLAHNIRRRNRSPSPIVLWTPVDTRLSRKVAIKDQGGESEKTFALLKDWRERFHGNQGLLIRSRDARRDVDGPYTADDLEKQDSEDLIPAEALLELQENTALMDRLQGLASGLMSRRQGSSRDRDNVESADQLQVLSSDWARSSAPIAEADGLTEDLLPPEILAELEGLTENTELMEQFAKQLSRFQPRNDANEAEEVEASATPGSRVAQPAQLLARRQRRRSRRSEDIKSVTGTQIPAKPVDANTSSISIDSGEIDNVIPSAKDSILREAKSFGAALSGESQPSAAFDDRQTDGNANLEPREAKGKPRTIKEAKGTRRSRTRYEEVQSSGEDAGAKRSRKSEPS